MGMYLGKEKVAPAVKFEVQSMKAYLEAGGKCAWSSAKTFEGCWLASDWENVTDFGNMFSYCRNITSFPILDTSNATNMQSMFSECRGIKSIPAIDTSKVTNMRAMFSYCDHLTSIPALDTSKVEDMGYIFNYCSSLTSIPALDTSNVKDMDYMFNNCYNLESIHMHGMKISFDIHYSTKFTREALVEILNNLSTVTTSRTLTMGSTNLAKLTDADKAIATGKGWTLR